MDPDLLNPIAATAAKSLQSCLTLCNPIDTAHQATPSLGVSRQEHWSGLPLPSPMHESEKGKWTKLTQSSNDVLVKAVSFNGLEG